MLINWTGELEKTLFERTCMAQTLKGLVSSCELMGHRLKPFLDKLDDYLNPTVKGTIFENLIPENSGGEECWLEKEVLTLLKELQTVVLDGHDDQGAETKARQYNKFSHRSAIFSPSSFSIRDSYVAIGKGIPFDWYAGEVKQIFAYPFKFGPSGSLNVYFVIKRFKELSAEETTRDPYRHYPLVGGRLYHAELEDKIQVVPLREIIAHFAHTPHAMEDFGFPCFHALPLDKVISHYNIGRTSLTVPSV